MQFKGPKSKSFRKLQKIAKNKDCLICSHRLKHTGVFIWSVEKQDATHIKCINCLTMYDSSFNIENLGIPREVGYS